MYSRRVRRYFVPVVIASIAALVVLGEATLRRPLHPSAPTTTTESVQAAAPVIMPRLGLSVERDGRALLVAWDKSCQPVRDADHGILYIRDGTQASQLDLDTQQLEAAKIKYWPTTRDVIFVLRVYQSDGSISDSIQAAGELGTAEQEIGSADRREEEPARPSPFLTRTRKRMTRRPAAANPPVAFSVEPAVTPEPEPPAATPLLQPAPDPTPATAADSIPDPLLAFAPPAPAVAKPSQGLRLGRIIAKIPLLRRLKKSPEHSEN